MPAFAFTRLRAMLLAACLPCAAFGAAPDSELQRLRQEIEQLRRSHEERLQALEDRLRRAERAAEAPAAVPAAPAAVAAAPAAAAPAPTAVPSDPALASSANRFNPAIALILSGQYGRLSRDAGGGAIGGFTASGSERASRGFNLGESELSLSANVDHLFYGAMALALHPDDRASVEEAFIQTSALADGVTLKAGRFFSAVGYLNEQHAHTWDFVDNPLAYDAFLGTQFGQNGLQARWLLPTDRFVEVLAEAGNGAAFPGAAADRNGAGAATLGVRTGGDWGVSSSWLAGVAVLRASPRGRESIDIDRLGNTVANAFSGRSTLWNASGVFKWAPNGNPQRTNLKLQAEYFRRREDGTLVYDTRGSAVADRYASAQSGWYAQGIYQFMPRWRAGLRLDRLASGSVDYGVNSAALANADFRPQRASLMLDWSPSEFSRLRLQVANDRSRLGGADRQVFLQYQMSLGAHGAHGY